MSQSALSFSDGGSALLRDPRQVSVKQRRPYDHAKTSFSSMAVDLIDIEDEKVKQKKFVELSSQRPELMDAMNDALILCLVSDWSYGEVNADVLGNLPGFVYDELLTACNKVANELSPNFKVDPDPKATTEEPVV